MSAGDEKDGKRPREQEGEDGNDGKRRNTISNDEVDVAIALIEEVMEGIQDEKVEEITKGDEDALLGEKKKNKKKKMAELEPADQDIRRAALKRRRERKRVSKKEKKAEEKAAKPEPKPSDPETPPNTDNPFATPPAKQGKEPPASHPAEPPTQMAPGKTPKPKEGTVKPKPGSKKAKNPLKSKVEADRKPPKGKESARPPLKLRAPIRIVINTNTDGGASRPDLAAVRRIIFEATLARQSGSRSGASNTPHFRDLTLEGERVIAVAVDEGSRDFLVHALQGSPYQAVVEEGHLRMTFTITSAWGEHTEEEFVRILGAMNPRLPSGSIRPVSRTRSSGGGWRYFVEVDRRGLGYLNNRDLKLDTVFGDVTLKPSEE